MVRRNGFSALVSLGLALLIISGCGAPEKRIKTPPSTQKPKSKPKPSTRTQAGMRYTVLGESYRVLDSAEGFSERGIASWYGKKFHGRKTANGEIYDMYGRTAAHKLLPLGTKVIVTNLENGRSVKARINDRGPFVKGRVIDLTYTLADDLGMADQGIAKVMVEAIEGPAGSRPPGPKLVGPFAWQVGAFTDAGNAKRLAAKLKTAYGASSVNVFDRGDAVFHRVRVGSYPTGEAARAKLAALVGQGYKPFLVKLD